MQSKYKKTIRFLIYYQYWYLITRKLVREEKLPHGPDNTKEVGIEFLYLQMKNMSGKMGSIKIFRYISVCYVAG